MLQATHSYPPVMSSGGADENSSHSYRAIAEDSPLGLALRLLTRPSTGQFELAFGARPRSDQRVGLLRKASSTLGFSLVAGTIIGILLAFNRGRIARSHPWTETDTLFASLAVRATLTYVALLLPLFVIIWLRLRVAERDHDAWLSNSKKRGKARFVPDPHSQPRSIDVGLAAGVCVVVAVPIRTLIW
jgi:hypothetical protein